MVDQRPALFVILFALLLFGCSNPLPNPPPQNAGITQLIETRGNQRSVWGVEITLGDSQFPAVLAAADLHVIEEKHDSNITDMMDWTVSPDRQRLVIEFKDGMGDFGTGDTLHVHIARSALSNYTQANDPEWTISTDRM